MTFDYPWVLLLLLLAPVLAWLRERRPGRAGMRFSDTRLLTRLPRSWAVHAVRLLPILYGAGLALLVVAAARPRIGLEESRVKTDVVDIVLLVDVSTSMRAEDLSAAGRRMNRLDASKRVIREFVEKRAGDRIAIVSFAALPYTVAPLTLDHGWLLQQLDRLKTGMLEDGTAIGSAIASAVNRLRDSEAESKLVVLLTDGVNNAGDLSPENAARAAEALGIKVYTVGAGTSGIVPVRIRGHVVNQYSEIDAETLQRVSDITGARFFRATDFDALRDIYAEIDEMERTEIDIEEYRRFEERFAGFAAAGLVLLLLEKLLSLTRLRRLP